MFNIVIRYLCTLQNNHHDQYSYYVSPYKVITILLTVFPMLYISLMWFIYFVIGSLYLLISFSYSPQPPPFRQPPVCSLYLWVCFCSVTFVHLFCFVFKISHVSEIMWYFCFSLWLTSLNIISSGSIHVVVNGKISSFSWLSSIPLHIYAPHLFYPFICWWTVRLLPHLGYCGYGYF